MAEADIFRAKWTGQAFIPFRRHNRYLAQAFEAGETVYLEVQHERSMASHKQQFAMINDAFESMPERLHNAPYAVSATALRRHALIATGYCDTSTTNAGSHAAAERVAVAIQHLATRAYGYAVVSVHGPLVICKTALSQSMQAMGKKMFEESKEACLRWIATELDIDVEDLRKQGEPDHDR